MILLTNPRKQPFDVDKAFRLIRQAVRPFPKAALHELALHGYKTVFQQLLACMISVRTLDEVTLPVSLELLGRAGTPDKILELGLERVDEIIRKASFHRAKAANMITIARRALDEYGGRLPCDREVLLSLPGIGPKCANLILAIACDQPWIAVDVHVHRVTRRWGYIQADTPERALVELEGRLPKKYWLEINRILVPFGKAICRGRMPKCSTCPVLAMCRQVGVGRHL